MHTVHGMAALRRHLAQQRRRDQPIILVPTMGGLHAGHLALVERARALQGCVVLSLFVNPTQFGPDEDLATYPRAPEADHDRCEQAGVDVLFAPSVQEMYPRQDTGQAVVRVPDLETLYCGHFRPVHFCGVSTVVSKLFHIVWPDHAVFGEKDYQQLLVIRRLVAELHFPIAIHGVATVREADGLALSSRNAYLTDEERRRAPTLYAVLSEVAAAWDQGNHDYQALQDDGLRRLRAAGLRPEYLAVADAQTLGPPDPQQGRVVLAAAWLGKARLIDNIPPAAI